MSNGKRSDVEIETESNRKSSSPRISRMRKSSCDAVEPSAAFEAEVIPYETRGSPGSPILAFSGDNIHIIFNIPKETFRRMAAAGVCHLELCDKESDLRQPEDLLESTNGGASGDATHRKDVFGKTSKKSNLDDVVRNLDEENTVGTIASSEDVGSRGANLQDSGRGDKISTAERDRDLNSAKPPNCTKQCAPTTALEISNSVAENCRSSTPIKSPSSVRVDSSAEIRDLSDNLRDAVASTSDSVTEFGGESRSRGSAIAKAVRSIATSDTPHGFSEVRLPDLALPGQKSEASARGMSEENGYLLDNKNASGEKHSGDGEKCGGVGSVVRRDMTVPKQDSNIRDDETNEMVDSIVCKIDIRKHNVKIKGMDGLGEKEAAVESNTQQQTEDPSQIIDADYATEESNLANLSAHSLDISTGSCPELESAWPDIRPFTETEVIPATEIFSIESAGVVARYFKLDLSNELIVVKILSDNGNFSIDAVKYKETSTNFESDASESSSKETNPQINTDVNEATASFLSTEMEELPNNGSDSGNGERPNSSVTVGEKEANGGIRELVAEMNNLNVAPKEVNADAHVVNTSKTTKSGSLSISMHDYTRSESVSVERSLNDHERLSEESTSKEESGSKAIISKMDAIEASEIDMEVAKPSEENFQIDETSSLDITSVEIDKQMDVAISKRKAPAEDSENEQSTKVFALNIELKSETNVVDAFGRSPSEQISSVIKDSSKGSDCGTRERNQTESIVASKSKLHDKFDAEVGSFGDSDPAIIAPTAEELSVDIKSRESGTNRCISASSLKCNLPNDGEIESSNSTSKTLPSTLSDVENGLSAKASKSIRCSNVESVLRKVDPESKSTQVLVSEENGSSENTNEDTKIKPIVKSISNNSDTVQPEEVDTINGGIGLVQKIEDTDNGHENPVEGNSECYIPENISKQNAASQSPEQSVSKTEECRSKEISTEAINGVPENAAIGDAEKSAKEIPIKKMQSSFSEKIVVTEDVESKSSEEVSIKEKDFPKVSGKSTESKLPDVIPFKQVESESPKNKFAEGASAEKSKETQNELPENISAYCSKIGFSEKTVEEIESVKKVSEDLKSTAVEKITEEAESEMPKNISAEDSESNSPEKTIVEKEEIKSLKNISAEDVENSSSQNTVVEEESLSLKSISAEPEEKSSGNIEDSERDSAEKMVMEDINEQDEFTILDETYCGDESVGNTESGLLEKSDIEHTNKGIVKEVNDFLETVSKEVEIGSPEKSAKGAESLPSMKQATEDTSPKKTAVEDAEDELVEKTLAENVANESPEKTVSKEVEIGSPEKSAKGAESLPSIKQATEDTSPEKTAVEDAEEELVEKTLAENVANESPEKTAIKHTNGTMSQKAISADTQEERPEKVALEENGLRESTLPAVEELDGSAPESIDEKDASEISTEAMSEGDALESDESKSLASESDDGRECEEQTSKSDGNSKKNKGKSRADEVDCAPTRVRTRKVGSGLSADVIPENTVVTKSSKSTKLRNPIHSSSKEKVGKVASTGRSLRSKSLDPPQPSKMPSQDRKSDGVDSAEASRRKRAATPEVVMKKDLKIGVRSSPRKLARATAINLDSSATPKVPSTRSSTADTQAKSRSYLDSSASSVTARRTKRAVKDKE